MLMFRSALAGRSRPSGTRSALATAVLAALASVGAVALGPAPAQGAVSTLMTVSGSRSAQAVVQLPTAARLSVDASRTSEQVVVSGSGPLVGVVLEQLDSAEPVTLMAFSASSCDDRGCATEEGFEYVSSTRPMPTPEGVESVLLPAGRYRVVLVADGAPVTVRLELDGLQGPLEVQPRDATAVTVDEVPNQVGGLGPQDLAFSGGLQRSADSELLVLFRELYRTSPGAAGAYGTCAVHGQEPPGGLYTPRCTTADVSSDRVETINPVVVADPTAEVALLGYGHASLPAGTSAVGHYAASAVPLSGASVLQVAIPLDVPGQEPVRDTPVPTASQTGSTPSPSGDATSRAVGVAASAAGVLPATGASSGKAALAAAVLLAAAAVRRASARPGA